MNKKILLVDDEEGIRRFLGLTLMEMGYDVKTAENGEVALQVYREFQPSIVLSDIKMPVMDGIELLRHLRSEYPDVEVIIITGHGDLDLAIEALKHEAADFITKPINEDVLEISLNRVGEKLSMKRQLKDYTENLERLVDEKTQRIVELERQTAAGQMVEKFSTILSSISTEVENQSGLFNELPCLVTLHNRDMRVVACNNLFKERIGDCSNMNTHQMYLFRDFADNECPVGLTFKSGRGQRSMATLAGHGEEAIPVTMHTSPISNKQGEVGLVLNVSVDMTELSRLKDELLATQHKYQRLFDEAPCYITVQNRDYSIAELNRRFKEEFSDGEGLRCYSAKQDREAPCDDCLLEKTLQDGQSHQMETVITTRDGAKKNVLVTSSPIRNVAGEIHQVMEMYTDITEIRRLQDHLTSLGLMLGSMSHGVKGMLTALDGGIYRLESGLRNNHVTQIQDALNTLKSTIGRVKKLVLDILYYAKTREPELQQMNVAEFLEQTAILVKAKAEKEGVQFESNLPSDLDAFEIDPNALSAALVNFLENAVDACEGSEREQCHVRLSASGNSDTVTITVQDNGKGMDKETRDKIFTLFFSSKGSKGTGLGLFISNQTIEKHGGTIAVQSEPGQGSTFTITLPRKQTCKILSSRKTPPRKLSAH
ncbi:PAS domain S-box-containing protein [Desulfonatronum thiosulfatophilum]|uniref:histidine kinase n=1 Tax=Desulfonatronum thiosulfatophilum TaxID=617002 RepID=A0A1G6CX86_9BACT|nr:response regulator [Desulfonatronum thiosulfatophilum]SDB37547.1 PAS domain S-box-containing protein [Desulfonatronum thiosulfatophilum]